MPDHEAAAPPMEYVAFREIPLAEITPSPLNRVYADDDQGILEMAASIKDNGLFNPISVRPLDGGGYEIISGEGRFRAMRKAGLSSCMCRVRHCDEKTAQIERILENRQRRELSPIEDGDSIKLLLERFDNDYAEVAVQIKLSEAWVRRLARIPDLISDWRDELARPDSPYAHIAESRLKMIEIAILPPDTQLKMLNEGIFEHRQSVKEMRRSVAKVLMRISAAPWTKQWEKKKFSGSSNKTRPRCDCCDRRSDRQPHLFADLEAEIHGDEKAMCLNPKCWAVKMEGWCKQLFLDNPGAVAIWDGEVVTPAAAENAERVYARPLAKGHLWEERRSANGVAFVTPAVGVFVGGPRVGLTAEILLRKEEKAKSKTVDQGDESRRQEARELEAKLREEYDALLSDVEDAIPERVDWLVKDHPEMFLRWCVWFGLSANMHGEMRFGDDWSAAQLAWAEDLRDAMVRTVMLHLLPDSAFNFMKMDRKDVAAVIAQLEPLLGIRFAALFGQDAAEDGGAGEESGAEATDSAD